VKVRILGSGTSSGVPRIGNDWGACDPTEPRNRRTRAAILVEHEDTRILVDTGPDMREQLLAAQVGAVDAIIWTHGHADHTNGIDDVRQIYHALGHAVPGYARDETFQVLTAQFAYVFEGRGGYPATVERRTLHDQQRIGAIDISVVDQPHGRISSSGLRFEAGGVRVGYATDFHDLTPAMRALYRDLDLWIIDALRKQPHPSHPTLDAALGWIAELGPKRSALVHMDQSMDYATLCATLPAGVEPGYDGLEYHL
jgi:phosphoribosyl 1,2-cyclic phosphate phosphodiesterase